MLNAAIAQQAIKTYFLTNSGKIVSAKDSAEYFLQIFPPDTSMDKNLFVVKEFYSNGKIKLIGNANMQSLKFEGRAVSFFPNGHKMNIKEYENGQLIGDIIEFYPNGRFYNKKSYAKTVTEETELLLKDCSDSTGKVLALNGNGEWIKFNDDFTGITEQGNIIDGRKDSVWKIATTKTSGFFITYKNGMNMKSVPYSVSGNKDYVSIDSPPEFPGGLEEFLKFLGHNIKYPETAIKNRTQGRVIVSFVVEKDGSLVEIKVARGIGDGCDEESVRVMKLSPKWKPGTQNGTPVRVAYSVPLSFALN